MRKSIRAIANTRGVAPSTELRRRQRRADYQPDADGKITVRMTKGLDGRIRPDRRADTTERDKLIRELHKSKVPMRDIANQAGCSIGTVHRIISKEK